ncbi:MAG: nucleotidyltransferase domain-containing protein [Eubacteriales bacterium]
MTKEFEYLLYLFAYGAKNIKADFPDNVVDFSKIISLAKSHTIYAVVAYAIKKSNIVSCPIEIYKQIEQDIRSVFICTFEKNKKIIELINKLYEVKINAVLLKGLVVSNLYHIPELRPSGDTDIYIGREYEVKACNLLHDNGFTINPRNEIAHHAVCYHPKIGCVELHAVLYDEIVEDIWFNNMDGNEFVTEPYEYVLTENGNYYTLGKTDHLIFLSLHMIKHFIISGLSLRMIMDTALFFSEYKNDINVNRFWYIINSLSYSYLYSTLMEIAVLYFNFSQINFPGKLSVDKNDCILILDDLENGGFLGLKDKEERDKGWFEYNRTIYIQNRSKDTYKTYMFKWSFKSIIKNIFISPNSMRLKYSYLKKKPLLIPIAWIHHMFSKFYKKVIRGKISMNHIKNEESLGEIGKRRVEMFRKLRIM